MGYQLWWILWFLLGHAAHINLKITEIMQSTKQKYVAVLQANSAIFLYRTMVGMFLFVLFAEGHLQQLVEPLNLSIPAWAMIVIKWPMNWAIAGLLGLAIDSALGYIPGLKNILPAEPAGGGS